MNNTFTLEEIETAHTKVKTGEDFPAYIRDINALGVISFETWVFDSHTVYFGKDNFQTTSQPQYEPLVIADILDKEYFTRRLKIHQNGGSDYFQFCIDCADAGISKWIMNLDNYTCTYFDNSNNEVLIEKISN